MKAYIYSLAAGVLIGSIYSFLNVRSPAPPAIALLGLLGMLIGEQLPSIAKDYLNAKVPPSATATLKIKSDEHQDHLSP